MWGLLVGRTPELHPAIHTLGIRSLLNSITSKQKTKRHCHISSAKPCFETLKHKEGEERKKKKKLTCLETKAGCDKH